MTILAAIELSPRGITGFNSDVRKLLTTLAEGQKRRPWHMTHAIRQVLGSRKSGSDHLTTHVLAPASARPGILGNPAVCAADIKEAMTISERAHVIAAGVRTGGQEGAMMIHSQLHPM